MEQRNTENKWMSVREMGDLLGIKKVERYWLVHKEYFETKTYAGRMWVNRESFENWYANQAAYHKVTGEEPGRLLKEWSYSPRDIARMLSISVSHVYEFIRNDNVETVIVDHRKRVPKEAFDKWYRGQKHYRNAEDRKRDKALEKASLSMPVVGEVLGIGREAVYPLLDHSRYNMLFETIEVGNRRRVLRRSIDCYIAMLLAEQTNSALAEGSSSDEERSEKIDQALTEYRVKSRRLHEINRGIGNVEYVTLNEAAAIAGVARQTITYWGDRGLLQIVSIGRMRRVRREDLENLVRMRNRDGIY